MFLFLHYINLTKHEKTITRQFTYFCQIKHCPFKQYFHRLSSLVTSSTCVAQKHIPGSAKDVQLWYETPLSIHEWRHSIEFFDGSALFNNINFLALFWKVWFGSSASYFFVLWISLSELEYGNDFRRLVPKPRNIL